jgi:hypothetical protein
VTVSTVGFILAIVSLGRTFIIINAVHAITAKTENTRTIITTGRVRASGESVTSINAKGTLIDVDADALLVAAESKWTDTLVRATSILAHFSTGARMCTRGTLVNIITLLTAVSSLALACVASACIDTVRIVLTNVCISATLVYIMTVVS